MSRLIDADALRAHMYHKAFETDSDMQRWDGGCWIRYKMFENAIDNAPTIEPQRMRGKWIPKECIEPCYDFLGAKTWAIAYQCYVCGFIHTVIEDLGHYQFCPKCGADMRGME